MAGFKSLVVVLAIAACMMGTDADVAASDAESTTQMRSLIKKQASEIAALKRQVKAAGLAPNPQVAEAADSGAKKIGAGLKSFINGLVNQQVDKKCGATSKTNVECKADICSFACSSPPASPPWGTRPHLGENCNGGCAAATMIQRKRPEDVKRLAGKCWFSAWKINKAKEMAKHKHMASPNCKVWTRHTANHPVRVMYNMVRALISTMDMLNSFLMPMTLPSTECCVASSVGLRWNADVAKKCCVNKGDRKYKMLNPNQVKNLSKKFYHGKLQRTPRCDPGMRGLTTYLKFPTKTAQLKEAAKWGRRRRTGTPWHKRLWNKAKKAISKNKFVKKIIAKVKKHTSGGLLKMLVKMLKKKLPKATHVFIDGFVVAAKQMAKGQFGPALTTVVKTLYRKSPVWNMIGAVIRRVLVYPLLKRGQGSWLTYDCQSKVFWSRALSHKTYMNIIDMTGKEKNDPVKLIIKRKWARNQGKNARKVICEMEVNYDLYYCQKFHKNKRACGGPMVHREVKTSLNKSSGGSKRCKTWFIVMDSAIRAMITPAASISSIGMMSLYQKPNCLLKHGQPGGPPRKSSSNHEDELGEDESAGFGRRATTSTDGSFTLMFSGVAGDVKR